MYNVISSNGGPSIVIFTPEEDAGHSGPASGIRLMHLGDGRPMEFVVSPAARGFETQVDDLGEWLESRVPIRSKMSLSR